MRREKVVVYHSPRGWRWRWHAANGRIIGASTQAYTRRTDAIGNLCALSGGVFKLGFETHCGGGSYAQGWLERAPGGRFERVFVELTRPR